MAETHDGSAERGAIAEQPSPALVRRELRDLVRTHEKRRRQLPRALLLGVLAGLAAVGFRWALEGSDLLRAALARLTTERPWLGLGLSIALGTSGAATAVYLVRRFAPEAAGSGIPHVEAVLHHLRELRWHRVLPVKFVGGVVGIGGAGLALGREGPTIQMGAAVGRMVGSWFRSTPRERQTLIAAGAGAGLSAAFNAPLAGLVFVLEEIQRDFAPAVFTVTLVASVVADVMARYLTTPLPIFQIGTHPIPPFAALPLSLVIGVVAAALGVAFNRCLVATLDGFERVPRLGPVGRAAVLGAAIGVVGWFVPEALAGGQPLVQATLSGELAPPLLFGFFVLRFVLTISSYGCGAPGGIFAPMLVLGATLGMGIGEASERLLPGVAGHPETFAVVGMAAFFTAVVRAPLTGIVLMVEMTGDYALVLPLLVAALTAGGLADYVGDRPIYEVLLRRDLRRSQPDSRLGDTLLLEFTLGPGAGFAGLEVRELGLPPGCVLVAVQRGLESHVPTAHFRLEAGDRITAVVAPQAASAVPLLREGTRATRSG